MTMLTIGARIIVINDETGDFVDADSIKAVMSTETVAGETTVPGSLIYLDGQEDVFVSPLTPTQITERMFLKIIPKEAA